MESLAMAIKPSAGLQAFSPSSPVSFSGFFLPQLPPAFLLAVGVPYLFLIPTFNLYTHSVVECMRVCMPTSVDSSLCHGLEIRGGRLSEASFSSLSHSASPGCCLACNARLWPFPSLEIECFLYFSFLLLFLVCLKEMREEKKAPSLIRTVPSNFIQRFYRKMIFVIITLFYIRVSAQKLQGEIWYLLFMKMKSYRKKITFPSWLNPKFLDNFCMNQKYVRELFRI